MVITTDAAPPGAPRAGPQQTGPIDHAVLEQLRDDLEDEDGSAVASLVDLYLDSTQLLLPDLDTALRSSDTAAAARHAHTLGSPTALLGAGPLGTLLRRVQEQADDPDAHPDERAALADRIRAEADRVVVALAQLEAAGRTVPGPAD